MDNTQKPNLPDQTWAVTKEDKEKIVAFGRELHSFILGYANHHNESGKFHSKIIAGGFEYFFGLQKQKATLIGDDILVSQDAMEKHGLGVFVAEPFVHVEEEVSTEEEKKNNVVTDENGAIGGVIRPTVEAEPLLVTRDDVENSFDDVSDASVAPSTVEIQPEVNPESEELQA